MIDEITPKREFFSLTAFRVSSEDNSSLDLMLVDRLDFGLAEADDIITCMDRRVPLTGNCYLVNMFTSRGAVVSAQLTASGRLTLLFVQKIVKGQFTKYKGVEGRRGGGYRHSLDSVKGTDTIYTV